MKTKKKNNFTSVQLNRLLIMADHFSEGKMFEEYDTEEYLMNEFLSCEIVGDTTIYYECPFCFSELPYLFPEE